MYTENLIILSSTPLENIPSLWKQNDILIFLIDLNDYDTLSMEHLNHIEKKHFEKLKTNYFKKRYIVSRIVLKCVLCHLLKKKSVTDISTYKDECGQVHILDHKELHICISYSENIVTLAVSKVEIGIDVETKRSLALKSTFKYFQKRPSNTEKSLSDDDILKMWTLKEAYCKFFKKGIFSLLKEEPDFNNACYSNYVLDNKYIFSIITDSNLHTINISFLKKIDYS